MTAEDDRFSGPPSEIQGPACPALCVEGRSLQGVFSPHLVVFAWAVRRGPYIVLRLESTLAVIQRWREALISQANDMPAEVQAVVSGHGRHGMPLDGPHLALIPLACVGHPHADGRLLGLAAALPANLTADERRRVLQVLARVRELKLGRLGRWSLVRETGRPPLWDLRPEAWTAHPRGATHWSTVTPIAFDRHPKAKDPEAYRREVEEMIAAGCTATGLPRPQAVIATPVSAHLGVPPAHAFPRLRRKDGTERRHTHAILVFDRPVCGPVLIGAGRYRGYGVGRPLESGDAWMGRDAGSRLGPHPGQSS
ncbi:MAG: type I-U CRISPR-associated protein Csb2 [Acidobacteria bacterium]|nr:type I-U CRISPR-associated protein Csb2 [Acidobacteriota bacterium]MDW7985099.1 type I-U CRISPR-associated protein Csb2 [Acidobacteriota bacterium]